MTILQRIIEWNLKRNLIKPAGEFDPIVEATNVAEEIVELFYNVGSDEARESANALILQLLVNHEGTELSSMDGKVDALCDIIVYATGSIRKLGYNPDRAIHETLKEIESRIGTIIDGKFVKNTSPEAQAKWYKAQYDRALIEGAEDE